MDDMTFTERYAMTILAGLLVLVLGCLVSHIDATMFARIAEAFPK